MILRIKNFEAYFNTLNCLIFLISFLCKINYKDLKNNYITIEINN